MDALLGASPEELPASFPLLFEIDLDGWGLGRFWVGKVGFVMGLRFK